MAPHRIDDDPGGTGSPNSVPSPSLSAAATTEALEAIAVVGMALNFPQGITSAEALWELIMEKRSTATKFPQERMAIDAIYHPDPDRRGQISTERGHFLARDLATFDAPFFAISTTDAATMDPQQRLLLETTYLALENAGMPMERVAGSKTSVYTGSFSNDWQYLTYRDADECGTTSAIGAALNFNANRISWFFNFLGTSANVDSACSSGLVCLDLACQGLRSGNENMSIVAGSNILLAPDNFHSISNMNMLSAHGESYSFDHRGDGYSRGEGVGVLVLKRVTDAVRDGDTIRGIIRNSGSNQDGRTSGVTLPNATAQAELMRRCYSQANLSMAPVRFVEAHGTGTPVGDPIEASGIGSVFRHARSPDDPMWVGAIKANIGHLEGASGIAGVIKAILALEKAIIPPNNNFEKLNSKIDADFLNLRFPTEAIPWPTKGLRRASVNSFGNGGTNMHVILDDVFHYLADRNLIANHLTVHDPPSMQSIQPRGTNMPLEIAPSPRTEDQQSRSPRLLVLSAGDEAGVKRQAEGLASYFSTSTLDHRPQQAYLDDVAYTLSDRRSRLAWRSFAVVESTRELAKLDKLASKGRTAASSPGIGFMFTGQGAQWAGMGRELMSFPQFQTTLLRLEEHLLALGSPWVLRDELLKDEPSRLNQPDFAQPLCTAIQIALVDLLKSYGIFPSSVVGHSSGEIAAAYCTGALSDTSAIKVAYYRGKEAGQLATSHPVKGSMMSVGLSEVDVLPYIARGAAYFSERTDSVVVACINSPSNVTLSGPERGLRALKDILESEKIFCRMLAVNVAYHSPCMNSISETYRRLISPLKRGKVPKSSVLMFSSVTGDQATAEDLSDPEYWVRNMVSPVRFTSAVSALCSRRARRAVKKLDLSHRKLVSIDMLVEVGPHSALQRPTKDILERLPGTSGIGYASCLVRGTGAINSLLNMLGQVHCLGYDMNLAKVNSSTSQPRHALLTDLPGYAFDHSKRYWRESRISAQYRCNTQARLDLLGKPVDDWNPLEPRWRNHLRLSEMPWMEHHVINGSLIYPGAGMLVMAIEAMRQMADRSRHVEGIELEQVSFVKSLPVDQSSEGIETQISLRMREPGAESRSPWCEFRIFVFEHQLWKECCRGSVRPRYQGVINGVDHDSERTRHLQELQDKSATFKDDCDTPFDPEFLYNSCLNKHGTALGPSFQRILRGHVGDQSRATAELELYQWPQDQYPQDHLIHPTTLDAMFQVAVAGYAEGGRRSMDTMVPTYLNYLFVSRSGLMSHERARIHECAWMINETKRAISYGGFALSGDRSTVLAEFNDVRLTRIAQSQENEKEDQSETDHIAFEVRHAADVDHLTPKQTMAICDESPGSSLLCWLDLLCHKNARLKILEIGSVNQRFNGDLLRHLSVLDDSGKFIHTRYHSYHFMGASLDLLQDTRDALKHFPQTTFEYADITEGSSMLNGDNAFDLVIAPETIREHDGAIQSIRRLLKYGGKLVLSSPKAKERDPTPSKVVRSSPAIDGLDGRQLSLSWEDLRFVAHTIISQGPKASTTPVSLVYDRSSITQQAFCNSISELLSSRGITSDRTSLDEAVRTADTDRAYIVVLELDTPFLYSLSEETFQLLKTFFLAVRNVVWVNYQGGSTPAEPEYSMIHGVSRVLQREHEDLRITIMSLDMKDSPSSEQIEQVLRITDELYGERDGRETEYLESDGVLTIPRIRPSSSISEDLSIRSQPRIEKTGLIKDAPPLSLSISSVGMLDSLHLAEDTSECRTLAADEIEIEVKAIGINYADCLVALGRSSSQSLGQECAGMVARAGRESGFSIGDRVVLLAPNTFRTVAIGTKLQALRIPDGMSYTTAAAVPAQFGTAWEAVHRLARLDKGESILIHAAAGGTGQAAIQVANLLGAEVFATVGSETKKRLLIEKYNIPAERIFYSRDAGFVRQMKRMINGRGVDVVLNSLPGDLGLASWDCIAPYGRIIDIGNSDKNVTMPVSASVKNISFMRFDRAQFQTDKPRASFESMKATFEKVVDGTFQVASPLQIYDIADASKAFHLLAEGKLAGKVVLEVKDDSQVDMILDNKPTLKLNPEATYVIAGGLGGLGRATARWMGDRGARNLLLLSRSGPRNQEALDLITELQARGIRVETPKCDISNLSQLRSVLETSLEDMPPVKGCMQATMVKRDLLFADLTFESWSTAVNCKTHGTRNLHALLPRGSGSGGERGGGMDFFILLSSASGLTGLKGQTNYNAGNAYLDAFARWRAGAAQGEPATFALDLAAMRDDGLLAEDPELMRRALGYGALRPVSRGVFRALLDRYCDPRSVEREEGRGERGQNEKGVGNQVAIGLGIGTGEGLESVDYARNPMMYPLQALGERMRAVGVGSGNGAGVDHKKLFAASGSLDEAVEVVARATVGKLKKSLAAMEDVEGEVDPHRPLQMYGVDSLLAVELRNWLSKEFVADVAIFETQGASTTATLSFMVARRSKIGHPGWVSSS